MGMTFADLLTLGRLFLVPVYLYAFVTGRAEVAFIVFVFAGFTDLIDGTVARLTGSSTRLGAILDPIADKVLLGSCFITLTIIDMIPLWFVILVLSRDLAIVGGIFYFEWTKANVPYRPLAISKIATFFQLMTVGWGLLFWWRPDVHTRVSDGLMWGCMGVAAIFIAVSGVRYVRYGWGVLMKVRHGMS